MLFFLAALSFVGLFTNILDDGEGPTVRVEHGFLRGRRRNSAAGGSFISFQGIPYAKPPLGSLRFNDAQPVKPWDGVRDVLEEESPCTQYDWEEFQFLGKEDCLYLNVYVPQLLSPDVENLFPVMVWIHGGGFVFGSSDTRDYGPDYLVAEGVILVSVNYRLGPFGFLYMDESAPGNVGLKDQVAALRWVRKNIKVFGGDPDKVTIFGQSAGGASVHYHMLSPMSKGLFNAAIAQSGLAINPWAQRSRDLLREATWRLGHALACAGPAPTPASEAGLNASAATAMVDCLRNADHMVLMKAATEEAPTKEGHYRLLNFLFVPTDDLEVPGIERFLSEPAIRLIEKGQQHAVPFITGLTDQENLLLIASLTDNFNETALQRMDSHWDKHVLPELRLKENSDKAKALTMLRTFFMNNKPLTKETIQRYLDMFSDIHTGESVSYMLKNILKTAKSPIYLYNFVADDELNLMKKEHSISWPGAAHGDDIGYLFHTVYLPEVPKDSSAAITRQRLVRLWTNFAKFRNPTPSADSLLDEHWPPYTQEESAFLEIGSKQSINKNLNANRTAFWEEFYRVINT